MNKTLAAARGYGTAAALALLAGFIFSGCPSGPPEEEPPLGAGGIWLGTIISSDSLNQGNVTLTALQNGGTVTGTWNVQFPGMTNGGTLRGTVAENGAMELELDPSDAVQCALVVTGNLSGGQASGVYATEPRCVYSLQGTLNLTRQSEQTPTFTQAWPAGGVYDAFQEVTLTAATLNPPATIYYTLEGPDSGPGGTSGAVGNPGRIVIAEEGATVLRFYAVDASGYGEPPRETVFHIGVAPPVSQVGFGQRQLFLPPGFATTVDQPQGDFTGVTLSANGAALAAFACEVPALRGEADARQVLEGALGRVAALGQWSNIVTFTNPEPADTVFAQYLLTVPGFATPMELSNYLLGEIGLNVLGGTATGLPQSPSSSPVDYRFRVSLAFRYDAADAVVCLVSVVPEVAYPALGGLAEGFGDGTNLGWAGDTLLPESETMAATGGGGGADFLFVVDNSGSMVEEQQAVVDAGNAFLSAMAGAGLDFRIGTITTDSANVVGGGFTDDLATFQANIHRGVDGSGTETGIYFAEQALRSRAEGDFSDGTVTALGYPRPGAGFSVVILSDEPSQYPWRAGTDFDPLSNLFVSRGYRVYAIVTPQFAEISQYDDLAAATGGATADIANPATFPAIMEAIALQAGGNSSAYTLAYRPVSFSIAVTVNGAAVHRQSQGGWRYVYGANSLVFFGTAIPQEGDQVGVRYLRIAPPP